MQLTLNALKRKIAQDAHDEIAHEILPMAKTRDIFDIARLVKDAVRDALDNYEDQLEERD